MHADERPFDADNHYYEPVDAFTRHLDPAWRARAVDVAEIRGRIRHVVGGKVNRAVTNPTFDPIVKPGCLFGYFRSNPDNKPRAEYMRRERADPCALPRPGRPHRDHGPPGTRCGVDVPDARA